MTPNPSSGATGTQPGASTRQRAIQGVTVAGLVANLALAGLKFAAGILGASQALVADAVHSLSDSTTDLAVLIGAPYWSAPADAEHPHGHGRIETMITLFIGAALGAVGLLLAYRAVATLSQPDPRGPGWMVFAAACVSMVSKEALYQWTARVGRRLKSSALAANAWHHRSDALSSLPVAVAVLGMHLRPDLKFLDHVAALVVAVLILQAAWKILWPALAELADAAASPEERRHLADLAAGIKGVKTVHALRTRRMGSGLQVDPNLNVREGHEIGRAVRDNLLREGPDVIDVLVHLEPYEGGD